MLFRSSSKNICLVVTGLVVVLNVAYFVRRSVLSNYCDVEALLQTITDVPGGPYSPDDDQDSISCLRNADEPWCIYPEEVDLRIIVLTFNRHQSLLKLLSSLNDLEMDGASVAVEIWIDRDRQNKVDAVTLSAARSFRWRHSRVRVHVHRRHVGIYGQWIYTWRPHNASTTELALILEDDVSVSPYAYRWLRAAVEFYADRRDLAGFTLQSEGLIVATTGQPLPEKRLPSSTDGAAFLYSLLGSWGFAPRADVWIAFQDWFVSAQTSSKAIRPYVPGLVMTQWYKNFEKKHTSDSMWTMWFIYFCVEVRGGLYTVYNNIGRVAGSRNTRLAVNRREPGLHYSGKPTDNTNSLLRTWKPSFTVFSRSPVCFGFDGVRVDAEDTQPR